MVEYVHEGIFGGSIESGVDIPEAEEDRNEHGETERPIQENGDYHGFGDYGGRVFDFLGWWKLRNEDRTGREGGRVPMWTAPSRPMNENAVGTTPTQNESP